MTTPRDPRDEPHTAVLPDLLFGREPSEHRIRLALGGSFAVGRAPDGSAYLIAVDSERNHISVDVTDDELAMIARLLDSARSIDGAT